MKIDIFKFQKDIKIRFKKKSLLVQALTHKSADQKNNNEKLEFLGDRVIGLGLSKKLFDLYPFENEGVLDKRFASLVNRKICCDIGLSIGIQNYIKTGNQKSPETYTTCYYPTYQFLIDWNGDIFLCPQDWQRRVTMGNMMQESLFNIWTGKILTKYRKNLLKGKRCDSPCKSCNAEGTLLGKNHAEKWNKIY